MGARDTETPRIRSPPESTRRVQVTVVVVARMHAVTGQDIMDHLIAASATRGTGPWRAVP